MSNTSGMAEVLAAHGLYGMSAGTHSACRCNLAWVLHAEYRAHLEAELIAAGFGLVKNSGAVAWEEGYDAGVLDLRNKHLERKTRNPYRDQL